MKSLFTFLVAALMVMSFSMAGFAQAQNSVSGSQQPAAEKKMESAQGKNVTSGSEKAPMAGKKSESLEKAMTFNGKVVSVNEQDKTLVVKSKKGEKTFDVSNVTMGSEIKAGHSVHVTYTEKDGKMIASAVTGVAKTTKTSMKHEGYKTKKGA
jgi:hypothetical protein